MCSQVSIGASSALGDDVIVGCGAAVKDHVCIKANSRIAARSGVVRDIDTAGDYAGYPAMPADDFKHQVGFLWPGRALGGSHCAPPSPPPSTASHRKC